MKFTNTKDLAKKTGKDAAQIVKSTGALVADVVKFPWAMGKDVKVHMKALSAAKKAARAEATEAAE